MCMMRTIDKFKRTCALQHRHKHDCFMLIYCFAGIAAGAGVVVVHSHFCFFAISSPSYSLLVICFWYKHRAKMALNCDWYGVSHHTHWIHSMLWLMSIEWNTNCRPHRRNRTANIPPMGRKSVFREMVSNSLLSSFPKKSEHFIVSFDKITIICRICVDLVQFG